MNIKTADAEELAFFKAFNEIKGTKPEELFGFVLLVDYGVTPLEFEQILRKFAKYVEPDETPVEIADRDINKFFGNADWKKLTVHQFHTKCYDLIGYKRHLQMQQQQAEETKNTPQARNS